MVIKILGTGCAKCKLTMEVIEKVAKEMGISPEIIKVEELPEIMKYDILTTPGVVVDEVLKIKGKVPTPDEVRELLKG